LISRIKFKLTGSKYFVENFIIEKSSEKYFDTAEEKHFLGKSILNDRKIENELENNLLRIKSIFDDGK
jgi:hypothetical protein